MVLLRGGTEHFSHSRLSRTFYLVVYSFLIRFCQTKYQWKQTDVLNTKIKFFLFPHYDVIGESQKISENFFCQLFFFKSLRLRRFWRYPPEIFFGGRKHLWADYLGSGILIFCFCELSRVVKVKNGVFLTLTTRETSKKQIIKIPLPK